MVFTYSHLGFTISYLIIHTDNRKVIIDTTFFFDFMFYCSPFKKSFKQFSSFSNSYLVNTVSLFSFSPIVCNICLLVSFKIFLYKGFCIADIYIIHLQCHHIFGYIYQLVLLASRLFQLFSNHIHCKLLYY